MTKDWNSDASGAASRAGQLIGEAFESSVFKFITQYLKSAHSDYGLVEAAEGKTLITLPMLGGSSKQMDTVIILKESDDPVALLESKWLKDARHHNDKGAWILQLREVSKYHPTIRGAAAILAGYWTEGVGIMLANEGRINMVWVASDEQIYQTLQPYLDVFLGDNSFKLDAHVMRKRYIRPGDLANFLEHIHANGTLGKLANNWLNFTQISDKKSSNSAIGTQQIQEAIDKLLAPLPDNLEVKTIEITLAINTGNTIHKNFTDIEEVYDFLKEHFANPEKIRQVITPKKKPKKNES
jgi:hypothetical protein